MEFAWFAGYVGESCGICVICWNFPGFSAGAGTWNIIENFSKMCEFCLIHGLCGRIARNLRNSLEFYRVLCQSRYLKHNSKMCEFSLIRGLCGWIARNLRNSLEFYRVLCRSRYLKHNSKMCEFSLIRGLCGRIARNLRNSLEFDLMGQFWKIENFACKSE